MSTIGIRLVLINCRSQRQARRIGRALVKEGLAAAANVVPGSHSIFAWQGKVIEGPETLLIAKTTKLRVAALMARARSLHDYDCPAILALAPADVDAPYAGWLKRAVRGRGQVRAKA
jgi:periplasmic divalent cation tolerance protein